MGRGCGCGRAAFAIDALQASDNCHRQKLPYLSSLSPNGANTHRKPNNKLAKLSMNWGHRLWAALAKGAERERQRGPLGLFINISGQPIETVNCYYSKSISDMQRCDAMPCDAMRIFKFVYLTLGEFRVVCGFNFNVCNCQLCCLYCCPFYCYYCCCCCRCCG